MMRERESYRARERERGGWGQGYRSTRPHALTREPAQLDPPRSCDKLKSLNIYIYIYIYIYVYIYTHIYIYI